MTSSESLDSSPSRFINRELSWLAFNSRVLAQAEDPALPLLERLKFCAIWASNLDEFFQVRVAGLNEQVAAGVTVTPPDGLSPSAQLAAIRGEVLVQLERVAHAHVDLLRPALAAEGIHILDWGELDDEEAAAAAEVFRRRIFPVLTPLAVDPSHPFPYISNLSLSLAVLLDDDETESSRFARVKVPSSMPRFISVGDCRFVPVEQVIAAHLPALFPGVRVLGGWAFRITRNADFSVDDEDADDLLEAIQGELRRRRFGRAVRLEIDQDMPAQVQDLLRREIDVGHDDVYHIRGPLDTTAYWELQGLDRADLKVPSVAGVVPRRLRDLENAHDFFGRIRRADLMVHHPYESFGASVTEFIRQAANDPDVLAIKLTLYRTSGDSPIIESLIAAAEQGKQVAALVELKARFDEENNIGWAQRLEEAGIHVVYGLVGLKIHTKTALVVRDEPDGIQRYCHIGTGNYNPKTARIYEDLGVLTADDEVGDDLTQLFNFLTGYGRDIRYNRLLVAPTSLRQPLLDMIDAEMAAPAGEGRLIFKMNSLVDAEIIDRLYAASRAGVEVDLIVRGICCLRAGVPGLSENIRVRSLVGRYLEHSRIYYFANGAGPGRPAYYIGSADLMPRNLDRRVEVVLRVDDDVLQQRLNAILITNLADTALAWDLRDDTYVRRGGDLSAHDQFESIAALAAERDVPLVPSAVVFGPSGSGNGSSASALGPADPSAIDLVDRSPGGPPPAPVAADAPVVSVAGSGDGGPAPDQAGDGAVVDGPAGDGGPDTSSTDGADREAAASGDDGPMVVNALGVGGDPDTAIRAAGCVVVRNGVAGVEVLIAHRPRYDDWSFPKGKREDGESDLECARRELVEETGFEGRVERELEPVYYEVDGRPKVVRYWLLRLAGGQFLPNEEVDRVRWVTPREAEALLTYDHDRSLLDAVRSIELPA